MTTTLSASPASAERDLAGAYARHISEVQRRAAAGCAAEERFVRVAGSNIRIQDTTGLLLGPLTRALRHLAVERPNAVELTVHLWDGGDSFRAPPATWAWRDEHESPPPPDHQRTAGFDPSGEMAAFNTPLARTAFHVYPNTLRVLDRARRQAFYWIEDAGLLPYYVRSAPLFDILAWWLGDRGLSLVHGGAVGTPQGGVLLVGESGAGKSTSTLACLNTGLLYAGDDYCLVGGGPQPFVHSLYSTAKLKGEADLRRFPALRELVDNPGAPSEKRLLFLHERWPAAVTAGFPLRAILIPRFTGDTATRLVPTSPGVALRHVVPSTMRQFPGMAREAFTRLSRLAPRLPCYWLETGTDVARIPKVIQRLLEELPP
jgi:hypothetical protein